MEMKSILITFVVVVVAVIASNMLAKKLGIGSWEESYEVDI